MRFTKEELEAKLRENPDLKIHQGNPLPRLAAALENRKNKYHARRTWSGLCQRTFDSKAEASRGEELALLEKAGTISDLRYQVPFTLSKSPKITITIDFSYLDEDGKRIFEDTKGILTRDSRTKLAWLEQSQGIKVILSK